MGVCNPDAVGGADGGFLGLLGFQGKRGENGTTGHLVSSTVASMCVSHINMTQLSLPLYLSPSLSLSFSHTLTLTSWVFSHMQAEEKYIRKGTKCVECLNAWLWIFAGFTGTVLALSTKNSLSLFFLWRMRFIIRKWITRLQRLTGAKICIFN